MSTRSEYGESENRIYVIFENENDTNNYENEKKVKQ